MAPLPRPGLTGRTIRLALGVMVGWFMGWPTLTEAPSYWDGFADPIAVLPLLVPLVLLSGWVVSELLQREWATRTTIVLVAGAIAAVALAAARGDPFGPAFGVYVWAWAFAFSWLLAPAFVLAGLLATPGCEMRAYLHLWTLVRGGDPSTVACPGWIDRLDQVRLLGRY